MNGVKQYNVNIHERINNKIEENKDIKCLRGYVNSIKARRSLATVYSYLCIVIRFIRCSQKKEEDLKYIDYINYIGELDDKTSSYQITVYSALKRLSTHLFMTDVCDKDYMKEIEMPKMVEKIETKEKRDNNYLTKEEIVTYINNVKNCVGKEGREKSVREIWNERDLAIIMLLLTTGMRCSALYKLDVDSIDFQKGTLITVDKEQKIEEHFISDEMKDVLKRWLVRRELFLIGHEDDDALFISKNRKRLSQCGISEIVKKYSVDINGKKLSPHKLRATYGTQLYEETHDLYVVQQCMNHSSPKTSELYIRGQKNNGRKNASNIMTNLLY